MMSYLQRLSSRNATVGCHAYIHLCSPWSSDSSCMRPLFVNLTNFVAHSSPWCRHPYCSDTFAFIFSFPWPLFLCARTQSSEQPASLAMTFCVLPSLCKVSVVGFETIVKSAVSWLCSLQSYRPRDNLKELISSLDCGTRCLRSWIFFLCVKLNLGFLFAVKLW